MYELSPTPEVQLFLDLISSGQSPSTAAQQAGLTRHESVLIRKLAGLPVSRHQPHIHQEVVKLRSQGHTHKQIAKQLSISTSLVNHCLCKHRKQSLGN